jgi:hypothetical protein
VNQSILVYRGFRYLKWAALLSLAAFLAYGLHQPMQPPNGGTWLGYTLGTIGALLILWLMWFGIRKRRYGPGRVMLEDWLSAHVYLGLSLIIVATLHTGFQFGWNVHTLAYVLMMAVIASGLYGVYAYVRYPGLMTENRRGATLDQMMAQMAELDRECRETSMGLGDEINRFVFAAGQETCIGGSAWRQLRGVDPDCPTHRALDEVHRRAAETPHGDAAAIRKLVTLLQRKAELVGRARRDVQIKALLDIWLYIHVPLTFALLAALTAHIVSVFFYW